MKTRKAKTRKVYIVVSQGCVQTVLGSHKGIDVTILDLDGDYRVENENEWDRLTHCSKDGRYTLA